MKVKTTAKSIRLGGGPILAVDYCGMRFLLRSHAPYAYTCGTYGWNFDVYSVDSITICTGYRGMPGRTPDYALMREYENQARRVWEDYDTPYEERAEEVERLLSEFLSKTADAFGW